MKNKTLLKIMRRIKECQCTNTRIAGPRGTLNAEVLIVAPCPDEDEKTYPLSNAAGQMFHNLLRNTIGFDSQKHALVAALVSCPINRDRLTPRCVMNCGSSFNLMYNAPHVKVVAAMGLQVARFLATNGTKPPVTMLGEHIRISRPNGASVLLFTFDDPARLPDDLEATDYSGRPVEEFYWRKRMADQAIKFKRLLKIAGVKHGKNA